MTVINQLRIKSTMDHWLVVWNIFYFSHILGIIIPIDFHIFQRGSNHQPDHYGSTLFMVTSSILSMVKPLCRRRQRRWCLRWCPLHRCRCPSPRRPGNGKAWGDFRRERGGIHQCFCLDLDDEPLDCGIPCWSVWPYTDLQSNSCCAQGMCLVSSIFSLMSRLKHSSLC